MIKATKPHVPVSARKPWVTPKRERLDADQARNLNNVLDDGGVDGS